MNDPVGTRQLGTCLAGIASLHLGGLRLVQNQLYTRLTLYSSSQVSGHDRISKDSSSQEYIRLQVQNSIAALSILSVDLHPRPTTRPPAPKPSISNVVYVEGYLYNRKSSTVNSGNSNEPKTEVHHSLCSIRHAIHSHGTRNTALCYFC
jgi:hypothetical protein